MSSKVNEKAAEEAWTILRTSSVKPSGFSFPTLPAEVSTPDGPARYALSDNGEARLLLPLSASESSKGISAASALMVNVATYTYRGKYQRVLELTCLALDLEKVFADLVLEIITRIGSGANSADAARTTIDDFRALLVLQNSSNISLSQVAGFLGELLVLDSLLDRNSDAWKCWRGPAGDRHDFASGPHSLEVKVSLGKGRKRVTINGFNQLEVPSGGTLHLVHHELEAVGGGILSVAALGRAALRKASKPDKLQELFSALGCDDVDDSAWNHQAFRRESVAVYKVNDGFPRLVPSMLAAGLPALGISNVSYTTDLSIASSFAISGSEIENMEEKLIECL